MKTIQLKGGSLNNTCLCIDGDKKFIRKFISNMANREYGYVRWYSQLKKLQRFDTLFSGLVPKVIDVGVNNEGAYFDIEYIQGKDIKTLFVNEEIQDVNTLVKSLFGCFDKIHQATYKHNSSSLSLYFIEEVEKKLNDAIQFKEFQEFYKLDSYMYKNVPVTGMVNLFGDFKERFNKSIDVEGYVHGNPTLENIMYDPNTHKITFIDLYEEGIVDSKFMDYSQILQCSNSYYSIINDNPLSVHDNIVTADITIPKKLVEFNDQFKLELSNRFDQPELDLINLFEATQFFRMLPFKCHAGNYEGAKFFYVHACYLVNRLL